MKSIRKIAEKSVSNNLKSLAGSALLIGATLTGGAAFASASTHNSGSMDLGDYPTPFVDEDGNVQTSIVLGSDAAVADVVGATEIAGSLGASAFTESSVEVEGASSTWSSSDGVTLDTSNQKLYFGQSIDTAKSTLTEDDLNLLSTNEVLTGDAEQDVEQYIYVGSQSVDFGNPSDEDQDPFLYVNNPAEPSTTSGASNWLYKLQANFQDGITFEESGQSEKNDDVYGQEVMMFGQEFTISEDSFTGDDQLVLYGSTQSTGLDAGSSTTFTIDGEEITVELVGINNDGEAVLTIDGENKYLQEDDSETVNGEELRVTKVNNYDPQDSISDNVELSIGSSQVTLENGQPVMVGSDEDEVEGTYVSLSGNGVSSGLDASDGTDDVIELSTVEIAVGADDSDNNYVKAEESFQDPVFDQLQFQFGGLNSDASEMDSGIEVAPSDDEAVSVSLDKNEDSREVEYTDYDSGQSLADSDGNKIVAVEGEPVTQDEYFTADAGDYTHLYEVTDVERDAETPSSGDEATVELEDKVTDQSVTVDLDPDSGDDDYVGTEVIDGQTYHFHLRGTGESNDADANLKVAWGTDASADDSGVNTGSGSSGTTTAFPTVETDTGARVAFYDPSQDPSGISLGTNLINFIDGSSGNSNSEMFVDDGTNSGTYEDGDDILKISRLAGTAADLGGSTISDFSSSEYYVSPAGNSFDGSQAIVDSSDTTLDSGDTIDKDGSAGVLTALAGTNYQLHEDSSGTTGYDGDGSGDYGEAIYNTGGDGTIDTGTDTRFTSVTVNSGTDDSDVTTVDLGLSTLTAVASGDADTGKALKSTGISPTLKVQEQSSDSSFSTGDTVAIDLQGDGPSSDDIILVDNGFDTGAGSYDYTPTGEWTTGTQSTVVFDNGNAGDGTTTTPDVEVTAGGASITNDAGTYGSAITTNNGPVIQYWDEDGDDTLDSSESIYIDEDDSGDVSSDDANPDDFRLRGFTVGYNSGTTVNSGDVDAGISVTDFAGSDYYLNNDGSGSLTTSDAILSDTGTNDANLESQDDVEVSGSISSAGQSFNSGASGDATMYVGSSGYDGSQEVLGVTRETSGNSEVVLDGTTLNNFGSSVKHDESVSSNSAYDDGESIVDDAGSGDYSAGDTVITGSGSGNNVQYWSSDAEETSGVSGLNSILPSKPGLVVIEEKDEDDVQESFVLTSSWDSGDSQLNLDTPSFTDSSKRAVKTLDSDDDVDVSYDQYGTYTSYDSDSQGSFELYMLDFQSTAGAAFTSGEGDLSTGGSSGSAMAESPTYSYAQGLLTNEDENIDQARDNENLVLVGGPAANSLTQDLVDQNQTMSASNYISGQGMIQMVDGFSEGNSALVVAGATGEDTRAAAEFLADYRNNADQLEGRTQVTVDTQTNSVIE